MRWAVLSGAVLVGTFTVACGESQRGVNGAGGRTGAGGMGSSGAGTGTGTGTGTGGGEASGGAGRSGSLAGGNTGGSATAGSAGMAGAGALGTAGAVSGGAGAGMSAGGASEVGGAGAVAGAGAMAGAGGLSPAVTVEVNRPLQEVVGFGVSSSLRKDMTEAEAEELFSPGYGPGLSILRVFVSSNGTSPNYADIVKAKAHGATTFIASARSAAGSCKDNGKENDGGHLKKGDCYEQWASTLAAFPALVKSNTDVDLYGLSIQNEPDFASCGLEEPCNGNFPTMLYTASELVDFVKVLGPKIRTQAPYLKIMGPETAEWLHLWSQESAPGSSDPLGGMGYDYGHALDRDAIAWTFIDIVATHQYDTQVAEPWPTNVASGKQLWMTEMSGINWWPEHGPSADIDNGLVVAGWIHDALVNGGASAWLYYQRQADYDDNNEGLLLQSGLPTKRYYTLSNFSRYVRPGYSRMNVTGSFPPGVLLSAYQDVPAGTLVVVAINQSSSSVRVPIVISGSFSAVPPILSMTPHLTSGSEDLVELPPVEVSDEVFTATLEGTSVTTFVGDGG